MTFVVTDNCQSCRSPIASPFARWIASTRRRMLTSTPTSASIAAPGTGMPVEPFSTRRNCPTIKGLDQTNADKAAALPVINAKQERCQR